MTITALTETNFTFKNQTGFYSGKVRDVYEFGDKLVVIATDRISAFDFILPQAIPYKGQVLNQIAQFHLEASKNIVPNWLEGIPDPNVAVGKKCKPFPVEMVVRGYLAGHAWREYNSGKREICGIPLPDGLKQNEKLPYPIITPTTKARKGHDQDISKNDILAKGLITPSEYEMLENYTLRLFELGSVLAKERGLILVDTKYEFGKFKEEIYLIDEIHTPDSSRYFYHDSYQNLLEENQPQRQLSKEFVREWLMKNGFQGKVGQSVPHMDEDIVNEISMRYIELFEKLTGTTLVKRSYRDILSQIEKSIENYLN